eukprot:5382238-Amphidinium_carterae.1
MATLWYTMLRVSRHLCQQLCCNSQTEKCRTKECITMQTMGMLVTVLTVRAAKICDTDPESRDCNHRGIKKLRTPTCT